MIQITLQFTSVETAIAVLRGIPENAFSAALVIEQATPGKDKPAPEKAAPAKVTKAAETKVEKSEPAAPAEGSAAADTKADAPAQDDEEPLAYAVLQKAVFALAGKSREAAMALNKEFGVSHMKDLPEGLRRKALAAAEAKLLELEVA
jgi:hypothetical protein